MVPMVVAMLILLICGVALSEVFGAQQMQSVMNIESTRATWIADAGLWHAGHEETEITTAVPFGGGSYTVTKFGTRYSSSATKGEAEQLAVRIMTLPDTPIEVDLSIATLAIDTPSSFSMDLVAIWPDAVEIEAFQLIHDSGNAKAEAFKLRNIDIWREPGGVGLPTGLTALNSGTSADRTIGYFETPRLLYESFDAPSGTVTYTLILYFVDAPSTTLVFSVPW